MKLYEMDFHVLGGDRLKKSQLNLPELPGEILRLSLELRPAQDARRRIIEEKGGHGSILTYFRRLA